MEKSVQLQRQIRENTEELQDYLRDLVNWEKEMKRKEEEIKKRTHDDPILPPIRRAHSSTKKKKTKDKKSDTTTEKSKESEEGESQKKDRIPGCDYRAWELFNVDEALQNLDEAEKSENKKSSSDEEESEESENEMYEAQKKQLALLEKDKGNQFFKKGNYDMAISCYTTGMEHDPSNAVLPANRAMALLKKGLLAAAEADCTTCLSLDPTYTKAYLRRGTARTGLKKYEEAKQDFCKVLDLVPDNNQAKLELERLEKEILLSKNTMNTNCIENEVLNGLPENSEKQSTLLEIENKVDSGSSKSSNIYKFLGDGKIPCIEPDNDRLQKLFKPVSSDSCIIKPIEKPPHLRSQKPMRKIEVKDVPGITENDAQVVEYESVPSISSQSEITSLGSDDIIQNVPVPAAIDKHSVQPAEVDELIKSSPPSPSHSTSIPQINANVMPPALLTIPQTSYQFLSDWRKLKKYPELQYEYVKQFPPEKFSSIFKLSIDVELFCDVLQILSTKFVENREDVFLYLKHLRNVGRFKTLVMFLEKEEISALQQLFRFVKSQQKYSEEEIQNVEKDYELCD